MSARKTSGSRRRTPHTGDYEVGYGKPPVKNQFKKDVSGNRGGRPKKMKPKDNNSINLFADAAKIFSENVEVTERGRKKKIPLHTLVLRRYIHTLAKSDEPKELGDLMKFMEKVDRAVLEGRGHEPLRIIIEGGLPDDLSDRFPPDLGNDPPAPAPLPMNLPADELRNEISNMPPANAQPDAGDQKT